MKRKFIVSVFKLIIVAPVELTDSELEPMLDRIEIVNDRIKSAYANSIGCIDSRLTVKHD